MLNLKYVGRPDPPVRSKAQLETQASLKKNLLEEIDELEKEVRFRQKEEVLRQDAFWNQSQISDYDEKLD